MIPIPRSALTDQTSTGFPPTCVVGIGNAGVGLIDSLTVSGMANGARLIAVNTDSISLGASVAGEKLLIGSQTTRGLGSGGDPELGAQAAEESEAELSVLLEGAGMVMICCGLGGGTGSGAATVVAEIAKRAGAFVFAIVTLPFAFEGTRRQNQAADSLHDLAGSADAVLAFENDRMSDISAPMSGVHETFAAADELLSSTVGALMRLLTSRGPLRTTLADLAVAFQPTGQSAQFGSVVASGGNRANEAAEKVLKSPLLRGKTLSDAGQVLVHVESGPDLRLIEVQTAVQAISKQAGGTTQVHVAISINEDLGTHLVVSVLAAAHPGTPVERRKPEPKDAENDRPTPPPVTRTGQPPESTGAPEQRPASDELFDTDPYTRVKGSTSGRRNVKPKQETLSLDPVRGRFEKSEPTIVGGEDLDVPAFIRNKVKLR